MRKWIKRGMERKAEGGGGGGGAPLPKILPARVEVLKAPLRQYPGRQTQHTHPRRGIPVCLGSVIGTDGCQGLQSLCGWGVEGTGNKEKVWVERRVVRMRVYRISPAY